MRKSLLIGALALFASTFSVPSSAQTSDHSQCFHLRVTKNGQPIPRPASVTFLNKAAKRSVDIREGRFCVPAEMAVEEALDLTFIVGGERLYFPAVSTFRFEADWDVAFGKGAISPDLSTSVDRKKACKVIVHQGEPEVGMIVSPCRVPISTPIR
jgi:hypothetical protein